MLDVFLDYFQKGGMLMYPLVFCSVISFAVAINRFFVYKSIKIRDIKFLDSIFYLLESNKNEEALSLCKSKQSFLAEYVRSGINEISSDRKVQENAFGDAGIIIVEKLERYLPILATIATISTLIGFTGTVIGMIKAFNSIALHGVSSPAVVATGIAEALITTVTGLLVAIPSIIFYHYFTYRLDRTISNMELFSIEFIKKSESLKTRNSTVDDKKAVYS